MFPLAVPEPIGLGTAIAESVQSLMWRTASIYRVSMSGVLAMLAATTGHRAVRCTSYRAVRDIIGQGTLSRRLVDAMELLSGRQEVRCTTFAKLIPAIGHGRGLVADALRICPKCMEPDSGVAHSMLAHQLLYVLRCPLHACPLIERCKCGRRIALLTNPFETRKCGGCGSSYAEIRPPVVGGCAVSEWRHAQMLEVVAFATDPDADLPDSVWLHRYAAGLTGLVARHDAYATQERNDLRALAKRMRQKPDSAPSMVSLLRVAAIQSVSVVELLRSPVQACSPRLLNVGDAGEERRKRQQRLHRRWLEGKSRIESLLRSDVSSVLPSKKHVFKELGLAQPGFWQHFPDLAIRYEKERMRRAQWAKQQREAAALQAALRLFEERRRLSLPVAVRADSLTIRMQTGASKEACERALRAARGS